MSHVPLYKKLKIKFPSLLVITFLIFLPCGVATYLFLQSTTKDISFVNKEIVGLKYNQALFNLMVHLQDYHHSYYTSKNPSKQTTPLIQLKNNVTKDIEFIDSLVSEASILGLQDAWKNLKKSINLSRNNKRQYEQNINAIRTLIRESTLHSNLILDSNNESYHTIILLSQDLPDILSSLDKIEKKEGSIQPAPYIDLQIQSKLEESQIKYKNAIAYLTKIDPENWILHTENTYKANEHLNRLMSLKTQDVPQKDLLKQLNITKNSFIKTYYQLSDHLDWHLNERLKQKELYRTVIFSTLIYILAVILLLIFYIKNNIIKQHEIDSAKRTNAILNTVADAVITTDSQGIIEDFNAAAIEIFGFKSDEIIGKNINSLITESEPSDPMTINIGDMVGTYREVIGHKKNGLFFPISLTINFFETLNKKLFVASIKDLSSYKAAEKELKDAIIFQNLISENIPDFIFVKDSEYRIIYANLAFLNMYPEEKRSHIIGNTTFEDYHEVEMKEFLKHDTEAFEKGASINEEKITLPNGKRAHLYSIKKRFYNSNGEAFILGISRDITETQEHLEELREHRENLENIVKTRTIDLENALNESKSAGRAKSDFFANMSHELRTPLNSIIGMTSLINKTDLNDDQMEMFTIIHRAGNILLRTVNDILDISKIEAKELRLEKIPFDIMGNIRETIQTLHATASQKNLALSHNLNDKIIPVNGDPVRLTRIVMNLVANAIRYTDEGFVHVNMFITPHPSDDNMLELKVDIIDTGIGISPSKIQTIFEKFTQADSSITRRFGGTGLGLAIAKDLVELMNGTISVESEEDKGSTFTIIVPFEKATSDDLIEKDAPNAFNDDSIITYNQIPIQDARFLLAEDHDMNQLYIKRLLENLGAKHFRIVENGDLAVKEVQNNNYDIVLMDCHMPVMSGYEATVKIRFLNDPFAASIPIVAMTANAMPEDKTICLQTGMNAYISKPIDRDEFKKILSKWIDFSNSPSEEDIPQSTQNQGPEKTSIIDLTNLTANSMGDEDFVKEMIGLYVEQAKEQISLLKTLCIDGDSKAWVEASHALKGTAGTVGAEIMRLLAADAQKMRIATEEERKIIISEIRFAFLDTIDFLEEMGFYKST